MPVIALEVRGRRWRTRAERLNQPTGACGRGLTAQWRIHEEMDQLWPDTERRDFPYKGGEKAQVESAETRQG